jgi:hypothetical protein
MSEASPSHFRDERRAIPHQLRCRCCCWASRHYLDGRARTAPLFVVAAGRHRQVFGDLRAQQHHLHSQPRGLPHSHEHLACSALSACNGNTSHL